MSGWPLCFIAAGLALRCTVDLRHGLWEDEIIAVTHAMQPFPSVLVEIVRNDIHPPLYFLQLHLWALLGHRDGWFVANSVVWSVVSLGSLWLSLRRDGSPALATKATAVLAVLPSALWMAQEVRPYAWMSVLLIWAYHFTRRAFAGDRTRAADLFGLFATSAAIIVSHAIGFLAPFFLGIYAAALLAESRAAVRRYRPWFVCFGLLGLLSVPLLVSNMMHDANLPAADTPVAVIARFAQVITISTDGGIVEAAGLAAYLMLAVFGLSDRRTRLVTACLIVLPMLVAVALGVVYKPIFKPNFFGTLLAPFEAIVLGQLVLSRRGWGPVLIVAVLALALTTRSGRDTTTGFRDAALFIRSEARSGDVVFMPQAAMFWGMAWYLDGPEWGSPLATMNPPDPQWRGLYRRLGPELVRRLGLMPSGQTVIAPGGLTLVIGNDSATQAERGKRVWLVTNARADLPPGFPPNAIGALQRRGTRQVYALQVTRYE